MCGEYGDVNSRPHYHVLVFGFYPVDRVYYRTSSAGFKAYTSEFLDSVWRFGRVYVGDVSFESAAYVARYVLKKVGSDGIKREILNVETGEVVSRLHEYGRMSRRPAIGRDWFNLFATDVFPHDRVMVRDRKVGVPKYYDKLLDAISPLYLAELKAKRVFRADVAYERLESENWDSRFQDLKRLKVHEAVKLASIRLLSRE
jgi:hypothetical protein